MSTPNEQFELEETISGLITMMPFFMMTRFVLSTPEKTKSPPEYNLIAKPAPVKPAPLPTPIRVQPPSLFKPDLTPKLKGRAVGWPRPGWTIKEVLTGERPLYTDAYVSYASIIDMYKTYVQLLNEENNLRDRRHKLKGPSLHSFDTYFRFAEYLGLVKKAGYVQERSGLQRVAYTITEHGIQDDKSWDNLVGTWKDIHRRVCIKYLGTGAHG